MNTRNPDFITVDLRGLKAALVSCAQARRESVSVLVRRAVARELGQSESVPQLVVDTGRFGASHVPRVKLSIRLTTPEAKRLAVGAHTAQMSRDAYLAGLITGVPALTTGASRTEEIVELIKSNAQLSSLSRNIHTLSRLLYQGKQQQARVYRDLLDSLDRDVRRHLVNAAALMADLRPRGSSTDTIHRSNR
ncbi:hypothetical protein [Hydrogenophaga sp.]|uniref:hypothetical protein n=1 Tax=Hydrogenophaga sp. TaxID=1904254 RepID=UPI003F71844C